LRLLSSNGRTLIMSSMDGYCSIITFAEGELGVVYEPKKNKDSETLPGEEEPEKTEQNKTSPDRNN
ncbi:hypothetical protein L9F63_025808, partial [Diploptera punctata]